MRIFWDIPLFLLLEIKRSAERNGNHGCAVSSEKMKPVNKIGENQAVVFHLDRLKSL